MPYLNDMPLEARIALLNRRDAGKTAQDILKPALALMTQKIALVSSFGAESAVLQHMVAQIAPKTPVLFIDTMKLFRATLSYQKQLANHLGLENVNHISPDPGRVFLQDTEGLLHQSNTDAAAPCARWSLYIKRWRPSRLGSQDASGINRPRGLICPFGRPMTPDGSS